MAYDYFSEYANQGPKIDVNLYGNAQEQGTRIGKATPSVASSIVRGVTEGVKTGQEIIENYQESQIRAQQLESAKRVAEIQQMELETKRIEQASNIRIAEATSRAKLEAAKNQEADLKNTESIINDLGSNDPKVKENIVNNPNYTGTLHRDPKLASTVLDRLSNDPTLSPEARENAKKLWDINKRVEADNKKAALNNKWNDAVAAQFDKDALNIAKDPELSSLFKTTPLTSIESYEVYPEGQKKTNEEGYITTEAPPADYATSTEFEVFQRDGTGLKRVPGILLSKEQQAVLISGKTSYSKAYGGAPKHTNPNDPIRREIAVKDSSTTTPVPTPRAGLGGAPTPQATPQAANPSVAAQASDNFNQRIRKPPPGMDMATAEARLAEKRKMYKEKYSPVAGVVTPAPSATSTTTSEVLGKPKVKPVSADMGLSQLAGRPIFLKTETKYNPEPVTWQRVNAEPLLANESSLIKGLASVESYGIRDKVSPTGVRGLLMVTRATANAYGLDRDVPEQNVEAGKRLIYENLVKFGGDLRLALTAYNVGAPLVTEAIKELETTNWDAIKGYLKENVSAKKWEEVKDYADRVLESAATYVQKGSEGDENFLQLLTDNGLIEV